jgi:hypothetical protein
MAADATAQAVALLERLKPDILKAFSTIPQYGSLGFTAHFIEGEPVRVEWSGTIQRKLAPRVERGRA